MEELCCNTKKKPKNAPYEIKVNEKELIKSLSPLVQDAKNYLYAQDMTEEEIQSMIKENNATEIDLIPLVMKLTEMDMKYDQLAHNDMSWLSLFGTTAYAQDLTARDIVNCALTALGVDLGFSVGVTMAKKSANKWAIKAMKKTFKTVVSRAFGPLGVAVLVVSFGYCLYRKVSNKKYNCSYALPTPSPFTRGILNAKRY